MQAQERFTSTALWVILLLRQVHHKERRKDNERKKCNRRLHGGSSAIKVLGALCLDQTKLTEILNIVFAARASPPSQIKKD